MGRHGPHGQVQFPGDLLVALLLEVVAEDDGPVVIGQVGDRLADPFPVAGQFVKRRGALVGADGEFQGCTLQRDRLTSLPAQVGDAFVGGDLQEPGAEGQVRVKPVQGAPRLDEGLLA
ncbi:MAG TPA: hypothetical protein VK191_08740 [Symbiobacteriaceae bacterium]|nr:hypothetical protein [Symbiobacteriaceae bacterium]